MPSVDVQTGNITPSGSSIEVDEQFTWTCSQVPNGTKITVYAQIMPTGNPWFETSQNSGSVSFTTPNASVAVTAKSEGTWNWTADGVIIKLGAHVKVVSTVPQRKAG
jgi:hypothetical protein